MTDVDPPHAESSEPDFWESGGEPAHDKSIVTT
jgi:hypothetical protein